MAIGLQELSANPLPATALTRLHKPLFFIPAASWIAEREEGALIAVRPDHEREPVVPNHSAPLLPATP